MSRRTTTLNLTTRDGTSRRDRRVPALDPSYVRLDERSDAELLAFVQKLAEKVCSFRADGDQVVVDGNWYNFLNHPDLSAADFLAWIDDPGRFTGEKGAWLGAPHRVLFATFLRLAAELRDLQNQFGARHLDFHVRKVLGMAPQPAVADRVAVLFGLSAKVAAMDLPAGTALRAGRDASGVERIYQTEQDLHVTRASVAELRALSVDRRVIGIPDVRRDAAYTAAGAFDQALKVALGSPFPGDAIPAWQGQAITCAFFVNLIPQLDFCEQKLYLPHHELRSLLQRVRRRQDANAEWAELNRRMGLGSSTSRDFDANFRTQFGTIDYKTDGLAQVDSLDDLYLYREERDVRDYITTRFSKIGYDNFVRMMEIKRAIDSEWSAINATLQRMGQRQRQQPGWVFRPAIPSAFDTNLAAALGSAWPPPWPSPTTSIDSYDRRLRDLEAALSMSVERARRLADFAAELGQNADANAFDWSDADALLQEAYTERNRALRRARIAAVRNGVTTQGDLERCATFVLKEQRIEPVLPWSSARIELGTALDSASLALLDAYLEQTQTPGAMARLAWADVDRVLELAWRNHASLEEPAAAYTTWHNAYSYADVTEQRPDPDSSRWRLFGGVPTGTATAAPAANFGFALRSGMLSLSSGRRKLTFTLGFSSQGFSGNRIRAALGLPDNIGGESLSKGLARVLQIEVSTEKGWVELPLVSATLTDGQGSDYFSLTGRSRPDDQVYPAIQLQVLAESTAAALVAPAGESLPQLRVMLRPTWDAAAAEWITALGAFEGLSWSRGHLAVEVNGLSDVRLQAEDRALDPKKASEPFGRSPVKGSRLYLSHPELVQNRLDSLGLRWEWVGLPTTLVDHYKNYPGSHTSDQFTAQLSLLDNHLLFPVQSLRLFGNDAADPRGVVRTPTTQSIDLPTLPTTLAANGGGSYGRRSGATVSDDLREDVRCWMLELGSIDFGHSVYGDLATERARALSLALATATDKSSISSAAYQVNSPYTPSLRALTVNYSSSLELSARGGTEGDVLLHIHPFGSSPPSAQDPGLFPATPYAGELYIGLKDVQLPQQLSLLVQLAEGTSDPDAPPATLSWWILDGHVWQELLVLQDSSRGLLNSGILTLKLPEVGTAQRLSPGLVWLRVAASNRSLCDGLAVRTQAVFARFVDQGNSPEHYQEPLPAGTIRSLVEPKLQVASVEQPYTSVGGRPAEAEADLYLRVSERLSHRQRAILPRDYERLALSLFPSLYKVRCLPGSRAGKVELVVVPDIRRALPGEALQPKAAADQLADIQTALQALAPPSAHLQVRNARYVPVRVRLGVRFVAGQDESYGRTRLSEALLRFLSPWAYDEGEELVIGGKIYAASIVDFVDRQPYVDYVAEITLFRGMENGDWKMVPRQTGYHIAAEGPDEVLVSAREHDFTVIPDSGYSQSSFVGIGYMKVQLDFIVGA